MKEIVLLTHLGLGDQIACAGMISKLLEKYDRVHNPTKIRNFTSMIRLFNYTNDVTFPRLENDAEGSPGHTMEFPSELQSAETLRTGVWTSYGATQIVQKNRPFLEVFYEQAGLDLEISWSHFPLRRDSPEENTLRRKLNLEKEERYIFAHTDSPHPDSQMTHEERSGLFPKDVRVIRPNPEISQTIFEYCGVIENAEEVHCIDSSFALLADRLDLSKVKRKSIHRYARIESQKMSETTYKQDWELIL